MQSLAHAAFESTWLDSDELLRSHFNFNINYGPINIGSMRDDFGRYFIEASSHVMTHDSTIYLLGHFQHRSADISTADANNLFIRKYALCSWNQYMEHYCNAALDRAVRENVVRISSNYDTRVMPTPLPSPSQFSDRADQCISNISCEGMRDEVMNWERSEFSQVFWRD